MNFKAVVPYRRFRKVRGGFDLVISREYKKIMKLINNNQKIIFEHRILYNIDTDTWRDGTWYDQITIEIND